jgi:hypothetical protein
VVVLLVLLLLLLLLVVVGGGGGAAAASTACGGGGGVLLLLLLRILYIYIYIAHRHWTIRRLVFDGGCRYYVLYIRYPLYAYTCGYGK